jgi:hypothetical protein
VGALPGIAALVAHGGAAGAIAEALVGLAVVGVFAAIWIRERSVRRAGEAAEEDGSPSDVNEPER